MSKQAKMGVRKQPNYSRSKSGSLRSISHNCFKIATHIVQDALTVMSMKAHKGLHEQLDYWAKIFPGVFMQRIKTKHQWQTARQAKSILDASQWNIMKASILVELDILMNMSKHKKTYYTTPQIYLGSKVKCHRGWTPPISFKIGSREAPIAEGQKSKVIELIVPCQSMQKKR
ncbi:MAG: hypothetical protein DSY43_02700 [Gammaproteobacteria bacterium]|nr:MAG: hypothetical protein DSY43_02700 [Gammaproteobacteria bacterium]